MMRLSVFCLILTFVCKSCAQNIICYYDSRAATLPIPLLPSQLEPADCTHYTYIGVGMTTKGDIRLLNEHFDVNTGFPLFQNLRSTDRKLLVLLGGVYESSVTFSTIVGSIPDTLINNLALFLTRYNFDGIDIDWRYPSSRGGKLTDKVNFQKFIIRLRARLNMINKLLVISVSPIRNVFAAAYDSVTLSLYADMINVYAFNFTETVETKATHLAPLYSDNSISVNSSISDWISTKIRKNKINIVVATYARTYTLYSVTRNSPGSPIRGPGNAGANTQYAGYLAQYEFCAMNAGYSAVTDEITKTTYFTKDVSWISSETADTLVQKYTYGLDHDLGGVAIFTLDWDDATDSCGAGRFPAVALARKYFYSNTKNA
ncbi:chitotriosidase-1-like [Toxorhynchites rutilus septentrionalis]|uniref:chitotriosidase-1-like n=1 Tax=Toxorhynchites rutilus septentrionalis TaxID=329112 RepID=UPI00247A1C97|nr:chitotriosidase-1-like [Toxorhynchites rutilus septentrionalis]